MRRPTAQLALATAVASLVCAGMSHATGFTQRPGGNSFLGPGAASIVGTVRYDGEAPEPAVFSMIQDASCIAAHGSETILSNRLVVNENGTLRWAFVYIREAISGSLPVGEPAPVTLDKVGCVYRPHVLGMQTGASLRIVNSDPTLHTVQLVATNNPSFNIALPQPGMDIVRVLADPEVMIPVRCNVHPWTQAYIGVVPHAFFAVSGEDGRFVIDGVPAGEYVLEAWHELLGRQTLRVVVAEGEESDLQFTFVTQN
ncbi:MAG: hypothetical protein IH849_08705 [Acidobacteria bacterium]|nr:hypothetical protein [Acidobacteriota bacterium]